MNMRRKEITDRIAGIPAWVLSLLAAVLAAFIVGILNNYIEVPLTYIFWSRASNPLQTKTGVKDR
jgi:hypothetical protein